jgi:hypothetical protein
MNPTRRAATTLLALAALLTLSTATPAAAADKQKVKPGATLALSCPGTGIEQGGTAEWFDKRGASLGTVTGTVQGGTVTFGPAPKKAEYAAVQLDCLNVTYLTGTAVLFGINDSLGRYVAVIYGIPGLALYPGSDPAVVQDCPAGTAMDFALSSFTAPGVTVEELFPGFVTATNTTTSTVTVSYQIACVQP